MNTIKVRQKNFIIIISSSIILVTTIIVAAVLGIKISQTIYKNSELEKKIQEMTKTREEMAILNEKLNDKNYLTIFLDEKYNIYFDRDEIIVEFK